MVEKVAVFRETMSQRMAKLTLVWLIGFAGVALAANPVIGTVTISPTFAPANVTTQVTVTALITDPTLVAGGANLQRLNSAGSVTAVLGVLHDDGLNGDAVAGDHIYTLVFTLNETTPGRIFFRASAAFQGVLQRVLSSSVAVDISNNASSLSISSAATPAPNVAGWNNSDVTVTFSCAGGAGGSEACPAMVQVSTEGSAQAISGTAKDGAANSATSSATVNLDKTPPILGITSPANGSAVGSPSVIVTGTVTDALSGMASFTCNGQTASITGSNFSCDLSLVPGSNAIVVQAKDVAGNTATSNLTISYNVTTLTIAASRSPLPNASGWNNTDVTVGFTCSGGAAPVTCPQSVVISNEGANQVISRTATDALGSTASASVTLKIDKTKPTLTVISPAAAAAVAAPQITVTGTATDSLSGVANVTCNGSAATINGSSFTCNVTLLSGANNIVVQAADVAGNTASSSLSVTLGTALTISATPSPAPNAAGWNNSNVTVTFSCAGGAGTVTCPSPVVVSTEGANQVISRNATDTGGDTVTASVTLKIDKTPPVLTISSPTSGATVATPQITMTGTVSDSLSGISAVTCRGVPAAISASAFSCTVTLAFGLNTIIVQASDVAGNATTTSIPITLATTPLTISASPTPAPNLAGWNNSNVTVSFTCAGGTGTVTCPSPVVVSTEGANQTISRSAVDGAGNTASASVTLRIDKTPPVPSIGYPASGATVSTAQITVTGTAADNLSGIAALTCNGSVATLTLSNFSCNVTLTTGANTITVIATDVAGNIATTSVLVTLSTTALTITTSVAPLPNAAGWNNSNPTVTFTCGGGTPPLTCPAPVTVSTETASQVVSGTVTDGASHSATASVTIKLDKTPPVATITSPASGATVTTAQIPVTGTAADNLSGIATLTCNGLAATLTQSNFSCNVTLIPGPNTITVVATDLAGNPTTTSIPVTLSNTALSITASVAPQPNAAGWNHSNATVSFMCAGGTPPLTCPAAVVVSTETAGQVVTGTVTDSASHTATVSVTIKLDKTPPVVNITSPANGSTVSAASQTITGTVTDNLSGIATLTCNGAAATVNASTFSCAVTLTAGANTITVAATDVAGNAASSALSLTYGVIPTVTFTSPANLSFLSLSPTTVSGTVSDPAATVVINTISAPVANGQFSAQVPLAEGPNILTATATSLSGLVGTASIQVTLDTTPPHVTITSPPDQFVTSDSSISVAGNVNDTVVGTVNSQQAAVKVNGIVSQVANRTFLATSVPLNVGSNTIQAVAVDQAGNSATTQITVTRQTVQPGTIHAVSGNNQTAVIGTALSAPLVVLVTDATGSPAPNKWVIFSVTQDNGMLSVNAGAPAASVMATTNAQGQASVQWTLGMRSGAGSDGVQAYSVGSGGTAIFTATATQGPAGSIVVDSGNNQTAAINQPLPKPLIAVVTDSGHNRLPNVPVTFTVQQGGGNFGGQPSTIVTTDSNGRAVATLTLGLQEGNSNNLVTADFAGDTGFPANFNASGLAPGDPNKTVITGLVLDNSNQPIPGVTIRAVLTNLATSNSGSVAAAATVQTDVNGLFVIPTAPVGFVKLLVDGSTAWLPGPFPTLDFDMVTVAGQRNTVGQPILLVPIKISNELCVSDSTGGGTLTIPEAPGFSLTFVPGQVTFPGGSKTGCVSVTVVHPDKVPMVPGFGQQPRFIVTVQPSGALFSPPAPITLPNVDGLAPREVTEMYSFDHDIGSFVAIGTGTVSDDGQVIRSNPGVGVLKAGWHCGGNPTTGGSAATCGACAYCDGANCKPDPTALGLACQNPCLQNGAGTCASSGHCAGTPLPNGTTCSSFGSTCQNGQCLGGQCPSGCNSGNPCILDTCPNGQCATAPNPACQNVCTGLPVGASCFISYLSGGGVSGTCDASGTCQLCGALPPGTTCVSGGQVNGSCTGAGKCQQNQCSGAATGAACDDGRYCTSSDGLAPGADQCSAGSCFGIPIKDQPIIPPASFGLDFKHISNNFFSSLFGHAKITLWKIVDISPLFNASTKLDLSSRCCEQKQSINSHLELSLLATGGAQATISTSSALVDRITAKVADPSLRQALQDLFNAVTVNLTVKSELTGGIVVGYDGCTSSPNFQVQNFTLQGSLEGTGGVKNSSQSSSIKEVGWSFSTTYSCQADGFSFFDLLQLVTIDSASLVPTVSNLLNNGLPTFQNCKYEAVNTGLVVKFNDGSSITVDLGDATPETKSVGFTISK